ncbi:Acetylcholinesterase [Holothuria leucospilota]|uniref:Acetylcholinesterase n=1 Tax=Holothuria leucospilota TaxID=206669 RepID=A0A9Q1C0B3_HOLLE|nr:Acetylcholinesterase [Holothuria leucospilota]
MRLSVFIKFVCFVAFAHQTLSQVTPITVTTNSGDVRGERTPFVHSDYPEVDTTVDIFKGIPYAKPPVGDLRFAKPEPLDPWQGEYDATYHRPICWQIVENNITTSAQSEDCLHLNIYSPDVHIEVSSFLSLKGGGH